jgi:hypothetical protein
MTRRLPRRREPCGGAASRPRGSSSSRNPNRKHNTAAAAAAVAASSARPTFGRARWATAGRVGNPGCQICYMDRLSSIGVTRTANWCFDCKNNVVKSANPNCWLLSALAVVAERQDLVARVVGPSLALPAASANGGPVRVEFS